MRKKAVLAIEFKTQLLIHSVTIIPILQGLPLKPLILGV